MTGKQCLILWALLTSIGIGSVFISGHTPSLGNILTIAGACAIGTAAAHFGRSP